MGAVMTYRRAWRLCLLAIGWLALWPASVEAAAYRMSVKSPPELGGKCVSTASGPFVQGMRVFIWDCSAAFVQTLDYDDQMQELKFGGNCVEIQGQDVVAVGKCNGSAGQHWTMVPSKDNYQIVNTNGLCINITNDVAANGTPLRASRCAAGGAGTVWELFQASAAATVAPPAPSASPPPAAAQSAAHIRNLAGTYSVAGVNPNGSRYHGMVTVTSDGDLYRFRWRVAGQTFRGQGGLSGRTLTIDWGQASPVIYQVKDNGTLIGTWDDGRARENLTPD
jgi:hypothetical protein